jgi:hypothetical protein
MTPEERLERLEEIRGNADAAYRLLIDGELDLERARVAIDLLQLRTDLVDLEDALARKTKAR